MTPMPGPANRAASLPLKLFSRFNAVWMWLGFSALVLVLDFLLGPFVRLSTLLIFPVAAAAWHKGLRYGLPLALLLPWFQLLFYAVWEAGWSWTDTAASCLIRTVVLGGFAWLIAHSRRQAEEIRRLRGLLPICGYCKKIRDDKGAWQHLETYLSSQSEARFTHGICPDCLDKMRGKHAAEFRAVSG